MAAKPRGLTVSLSPAALDSLNLIWGWNAETYGDRHADRYIAFLRAETGKLSYLYFVGKPVPTRPNLSYITIRKRRGGHGHVAVYELIGAIVYVLDYYHTAQNWQARLREEEP
jgi:plasmid stabilization system protein ParE